MKTAVSSHHLLICPEQYRASVTRSERERCGSVRVSRFKVFLLALTVMAAGVVTAPPLWAGPKKSRPPKQRGPYEITISGYYAGTGTARADETTVTVRARVRDEAGTWHTLRSEKLKRDGQRYNHFRGKGALDGSQEVIFDGRVDPADTEK